MLIFTQNYSVYQAGESAPANTDPAWRDNLLRLGILEDRPDPEPVAAVPPLPDTEAWEESNLEIVE